MPTDSLELPPYDLVRGMEFVALWVMVIFAAVIVFSFNAQVRLMNTYDAVNSTPSSKPMRIQVIINYIKRVIFWVMGYRGEDREKQPISELDANWILTNFRKIFFRFCIFYFVYIWGLVLTTKAVRIDASGIVHVIFYTPKQIFGFAMIGIYILSNSLCDILSIYFATKALGKVQKDPRLKTELICVLKALA